MTNNRPVLTIDLLGPDGNVFVVISRARSKLTGQMLEHFNTDLGRATLIDEGISYKDILAIVNQYVRLIDKSGLYSEYSIDRTAITAAIVHFNEQLQTLPDGYYCPLEGLYPDFTDPDIGPEIYLSFVIREIVVVEEKMAQYRVVSPPEPLQRLLAMLQDCVSALRRAGIE